MNNLSKTVPIKMDTQERILETAEQLFARRGFETTSLRHITKEARVNLAAVNYHFGSKEGLLKELLRMRIVPMNEKRRSMLEAFRFQNSTQPVPLENVFEAFLRPFFGTGSPGGDSEGLFLRMMGRLSAEKPGFMESIYQEHFRDIQELFINAIKEARPNLREEEVFWRFHFALTLMLSSMTQRQRLKISSHGRCQTDDIEGLIERLIAFICAGFQSPVASENSVAAMGVLS